MPLPVYVELTAASEHDLTVMRPVFDSLTDQTIMADKIYCNKPLNGYLAQTRNCHIYTRVKLVKGHHA